MERIGVDIDDVLFPWYDLAHVACVAAGITNGVTPTQWAMHEDYGCTLEEWLAAVEPMAVNGTYLLEPYEGAVATLERIKAAGKEIHLITARGFFANGDEIRSATQEWVSIFFPFVDSLTFSKDKTILHTDAFIDDNAANYDALVAGGINAYLLNRPHNRPWEDHRQRVESLEDFADIVLAA